MPPKDRLWVHHAVLLLLHCHSIFVSTLLLSYVGCTGANFYSLQALMSPKQDCVYSLRHSKSVAPSVWIIIASDDERDPEYVPPDTLTSTRATWTTRSTLTKVAPGGLTFSQLIEEHILTCTPSGYVAQSEGASGL